jgi:hypothetical protein
MLSQARALVQSWAATSARARTTLRRARIAMIAVCVL